MDTTKTNKDSSITLRISSVDADRLAKAAKLTGSSRTEFILTAALRKAEETFGNPSFYLIEKISDRYCYKNRPKLEVFLNYYLFTGKRLSEGEWEDSYGLPRGSITEARLLCNTIEKASYDSWVENYEQEAENEEVEW